MCLWAHQEGKWAPFIQDMSGEDAFKNPGVNWRTRTRLIVIGPITAHNIMVKHEQQKQNLKKTDEKIKAPLQQRERLHKRRQTRRCESSITVQLLQEFLLFLFHLFVLFGNSFMNMIVGLSLSFCNVLIGHNVPLSVYSGAGPLCAAWGRLSSPAGSPKQWLQPPKSSPWATVIRLYLLRPNGKRTFTHRWTKRGDLCWTWGPKIVAGCQSVSELCVFKRKLTKSNIWIRVLD